MYYDEIKAKEVLLKAVESMKNNPKCDISDEELMRRYKEYTQEDHLKILANMLNVLEEERKAHK